MYSEWRSCQFLWRHKNSALSFKYWIDIACRHSNIWIDITSNKSKKTMHFYFVVLKILGFKDSDSNIIIIL